MARASVYTRIPLDRAAAILGIDPLHFNGVVSDDRPELNACDDIWFQYASQREGQGSREDLAFALKTAEELTFKHLGYPLVPVWVKNEEVQLPRPYAVELYAGPINSRGNRKSVRANYGFIIEGGVRAKTLIDDAAAVVYSDVDGDGYAETGTVTVSTTVTDGQEIHAYYPGKSGSDAWEIRPLTVTISSGTATITFRKELAADENLIEKYPTPDVPGITIDGDDNTNFLSTVDIYRVYNDPSNHGTLYSEIVCDDCSTTGTVELRIRNGELGIFSYRHMDWDSTALEYTTPATCLSEPIRAEICYRAGKINYDMDRPYLDMDPMWERAIVYYATTLMDRPESGCENTHNIWRMQREDLSKNMSGASGSSSFSVSFDDLRNPLGTTRAALLLWKMIKRERKAAR